MSVFFIDIEAFQDDNADYLIKELCIMNVDNILQPFHYMFDMTESMGSLSKRAQTTNEYLRLWRHHLRWIDGDSNFDPSRILNDLKSIPNDALFYVNDHVNGKKINTLNKYLPNFRIVNYNLNEPSQLNIPDNIFCPYYNHGDYCAYKKCLKLCVQYLSSCK